MHVPLIKGNSCALLERIRSVAVDFGSKMAVTNEFGQSISYSKLWESATDISGKLLGPQMKHRSVAIKVSDPVRFTVSLLATWMNDSVAIPLRKSFYKLQL